MKPKRQISPFCTMLQGIAPRMQAHEFNFNFEAGGLIILNLYFLGKLEDVKNCSTGSESYFNVYLIKFRTFFLKTIVSLIVPFSIIFNSFSQQPGNAIYDDRITWEHTVRKSSFEEMRLNSKKSIKTYKSFTNSDDIILMKINDSLYQTEHILFIIPSKKIVQWPDYQSVFGDEQNAFGNKKIDGYYIPKLTQLFPYDFNTIVIISDSVSPNYVPNYIFRRLKATGINQNATSYDDIDICRYNVGDTKAISALNVIDHEMGHGWGVFIEPTDVGHWPYNSTVVCKMDNHWYPVRFPVGDPEHGFYWKAQTDLQHNNISYSKQHLYLMGLQPRFPDAYLLKDAVFNVDSTMSYSSYEKFDYKTIIEKYGPRIPDYRSSPKKYKVGFICVSPNLHDVLARYSNYEKAVRDFSCSTEKETNPASPYYYAAVPFLVCTNYRASLDSRLSDLDGNSSPLLQVTTKYNRILPGETVSINYTSSDNEDGLPVISCFPSEKITINSNSLVFDSKGEEGTYFYTLKATDSGGKVTFDHFVVDVKTCDNVITKISKTINEGDSTLLGGKYRKQHGTFYDYILTNKGCDSVIVTELKINILPATTSIINPANNATEVQTPVQYTLTNATNATQYEIIIATDSNYSNIIKDTIVSNLTPAIPLQKGITYFTKASGKNSNGNGAWTETTTFSTQAAPVMPGTTSIASPTNNATGVQTPVQFTLTTANNATQYEIIVATDFGYSNIIIDTIVGNLTPTLPLQSGITYYSKASGKNSNGNGAWTETTTFSTEMITFINQNLPENIRIYPNPAKDILLINNLNTKTLINIYSITGQKIFDFYNTSKQAEISIGKLERGIYIIKLTNIYGNFFEKIVKE